MSSKDSDDDLVLEGPPFDDEMIISPFPWTRCTIPGFDGSIPVHLFHVFHYAIPRLLPIVLDSEMGDMSANHCDFLVQEGFLCKDEIVYSEFPWPRCNIPEFDGNILAHLFHVFRPLVLEEELHVPMGADGRYVLPTCMEEYGREYAQRLEAEKLETYELPNKLFEMIPRESPRDMELCTTVDVNRTNLRSKSVCKSRPGCQPGPVLGENEGKRPTVL